MDALRLASVPPETLVRPGWGKVAPKLETSFHSTVILVAVAGNGMEQYPLYNFVKEL